MLAMGQAQARVGLSNPAVAILSLPDTVLAMILVTELQAGVHQLLPERACAAMERVGQGEG